VFTITGKTGDASITNADIAEGTYTLSETGPALYEGQWSCQIFHQGLPIRSTTGPVVKLVLEDQATCTITNRSQSNLTLVKHVVLNNSGQIRTAADYTVTATPVLIPGQPTLTGTGDPNNGGVKAVPILSGTYTLAETPTDSGFIPSNWSCEGAVSVIPVLLGTATIVVAPGNAVVCEITNTAVDPNLTLVKEVENGSTGFAVPRDWDLTATTPDSGGFTITGKTGDVSITNADIAVGTYTLSETGPALYEGQWSCVVTHVGVPERSTTGPVIVLALDDRAVCSITNRSLSTLTLVKKVELNKNGLIRTPADYTLTATPVVIPGQPTVSGNGDPTSGGGVNLVRVLAGTYTLTENPTDTGFTPGLWSCTGATSFIYAGLGSATIVVPDGADVSCQITNTAVDPNLTLRKLVQNGSTGTAVPTDFILTAFNPAGGGSTISGTTGSPSVTGADVAIGDFTLSESGPANYTGDWECVITNLGHPPRFTTGTVVSLILEDQAVCTVTNTHNGASNAAFLRGHGRGLPNTGLPVAGPLLFGGLLTAAGAGVWLWIRRRRNEVAD